MDRRVTTRNASFQQWQAYLHNRSKRHRAQRFLIQGVRPITLATQHDWPLEALLFRHGGGQLSAWARGVLEQATVPVTGVAPELLGELGEKDSAAPELVAVAKFAVAGTRASVLAKWRPVRADPVVVVFDRPGSPGNLGTVIRSADAFGADAVVVAGHGADQFDPQSVRASTGSLFAMPVFRAESATELVAWRDGLRGNGIEMQIVGTDETGAEAIDRHDFRAATMLVVGNETRGMSAQWRAACDVTVQIPIGGAASSLGAPSAAAVALYEIARRRRD